MAPKDCPLLVESVATLPTLGDAAAVRRVVAVVVTHNRKRQVRETLAALLAEPPSVLAGIVVVDNASRDGTASVLETFVDPRLHVLRLPRNRGGAGGFEAGMRYAMQTLSPDWLLLMDDDARPLSETLQRFHALDLNGWDAIAGSVRLPTGSFCPLNRPAFDPFKRPKLFWKAALGFGRKSYHVAPEKLNSEALIAIDFATFVGFFISRQAVEKIGYPDGRMFIYGDDTHYTLRLRQAGFRLGYAPRLDFCHDSESFDTRRRRLRPLWKIYYRRRNALIVYRLAAGWKFWPLLLWLLPLWGFALRHYEGECWRALFLTALAVWDALTGRLDRRHGEIVARAKGRKLKRLPRKRRLAEAG